MSDTVFGVVEKITEKKTAKGTFYSINVEGDWYGFGKEAPDFGEGSEVEFDIRWNGDFANVDNDTLDVVDLVEPEKKKAPARGRGRGNSGGSDRKSSGGRSAGRSNSRRNNDDDDDEDDKPSRGRSSSRKPASKPAAKSGGAGAKADVDWDLKDKKIQWQSCRNAAIELAQVAIACEALVLPAKKADKLEALEAWVSEKTQEFFLDIQEERWEDAE